MGISTAPIEPGWGALDYVRWAAQPGVPYLVKSCMRFSGYLLDNGLLSSGIVAGGIIFLFFLLSLVVELRQTGATQSAKAP